MRHETADLEQGQGATPVILVGAGAMGQSWLQAIGTSPDVQLAGIVDLDLGAARAAAASNGFDGVPVGTEVSELIESTGSRAIINVTVPSAHHAVTTAALFAGADVLGEKPVADDVAQALSLVATAEVTGRLFVVSQSRRYNPHAFMMRAQAAQLGDVGSLTTEFFKAPRFGGFREQMANPLLVDMAIHQFDLARFLLDSDPVSVYCETYNPPWSWFDGAASATAIFEMDCGARYSYAGSWCSPGAETSWNGTWRLSAQHGTVLWNGDEPPIQVGGAAVTSAVDPGIEIAGALAAFITQLRGGEPSMCEVHQNVLSLAMVDAAVESSQTGTRVVIDEVLQRAHSQAIAREQRDDVRARLKSWRSVREVVRR